MSDTGHFVPSPLLNRKESLQTAKILVQILGLMLVTRAGAHAQSASGKYAGAAVCGGCHRSQFIGQSASAHANALFPVDKHPLRDHFFQQPARRGPYEYTFLQNPALELRIRDAKDEMVLPVEWAFGAGMQAVTFVTRVSSQWFLEHSMSYYSATKRLSVTPGQGTPEPASIKDAAGVLYRIDDPATGIAGCFQCHSTGPVSFESGGEPRLTEPGVHCEACHGGGADHSRKPDKVVPAQLRKRSGEEINQLCGRCHRPPARDGEKIDWNYAWNVRHQPVYLNESRCFQKSAGALSCVTCHDPHKPAGEMKIEAYNKVCTTCHSQTESSPTSACPRGNTNCVDCHMPLVSPQPALRFTNHWIGVYRTASRLRPVR